MKKISIKKLALRYFKGVREAEYEFGDYVNVVKGRNGVGKSTIADAICWVLFGMNSAGDAKFGLKTRREDGSEIEDVEHSVEMTLAIDGEETVLKRALKDSTDKNGKVTNTYSYYVDGDAETAGDYKKRVDGICTLDAFKMCSSPTAFVGQDWQTKRKFLADMAGRPEWEDVTQGEARFDWMKDKLANQGAAEIAKHIGYKRKEVQKQLDEVPVRLDELKKVLPEKLDWENLTREAEVLRSDIGQNEAKLRHAETEGTDVVEREATRKKLDLAQKRKDQMEAGARNKLRETIEEHQKEFSEKRRKHGDARDTVIDLKKKRESLERLLQRCEEQRTALEQEKVDGAAVWKTIAARTWEWNDKDSFCPTCGQPLPADRLEEMKAESEKRFNASVAEEKKKLLAKAARLNDALKECDENISHYNEELKNVDAQTEKAEKIASEAFADFEKMRDAKEPTLDGVLADYPSYKEVSEEVARLTAQLDEPTIKKVDSELVAHIKADIEKLKAEHEEVKGKLSTKSQYDTVTARIEEAKAERVKLQGQLDELDEQYRTASEYDRRECEVLERTINEKFLVVKWSMFTRTLDGTRKPWCECSVDGVPYPDLNTAGRINAGLDIVNFFKKYMDIDVPCIIDGAESVLEPLYDGGQQIRLMVTEDEKMEFEYIDA